MQTMYWLNLHFIHYYVRKCEWTQTKIEHVETEIIVITVSLWNDYQLIRTVRDVYYYAVIDYFFQSL